MIRGIRGQGLACLLNQNQNTPALAAAGPAPCLLITIARVAFFATTPNHGDKKESTRECKRSHGLNKKPTPPARLSFLSLLLVPFPRLLLHPCLFSDFALLDPIFFFELLQLPCDAKSRFLFVLQHTTGMHP